MFDNQQRIIIMKESKSESLARGPSNIVYSITYAYGNNLKFLTYLHILIKTRIIKTYIM